MDTPPRTPYPTDVSDEEWAFLALYLTLMREDAPQRKHSLCELFNGLRFITRTGLQWRYMPHDRSPWPAVYQQTRRWLHGAGRALGDPAGREQSMFPDSAVREHETHVGP